MKLLNDAQMRSFMANGYITLQPGLPESFHNDIYGEFDKLIPDGYSEIPGKQKLNNPGNNILPMLPQLMDLFEDDVIRGGLTSLLGEGYILEPHRALHNSMPNDPPQPMHKDSYFGYKRHVRSHRPWTLLLMYYPQETPAERGPTGVIPGSQYSVRNPGLTAADSLPLAGPQGTVAIVHFDLWHARTLNRTNRKRFMLKFLFSRTKAPLAPSWDCSDASWQDPEELPAEYPLRPVWRSGWQWLTGQGDAALPGPNGRTAALQADLEAGDWRQRAAAAAELAGGEASARTIELLGQALGDAHEQVGLNAAYALAQQGERGAAMLGESMRSEDGPNIPDDDRTVELGTTEGNRSRNATYGLAAADAEAEPVLLKALAEGGARVRKHAAFALGEHSGRNDRVDQALVAACADADPEVRENARYSLGRRTGNGVANAALIESLGDRNTEARIHGALALLRRAPQDPAVVAALAKALEDDNRYVVGFAAEALGRIRTPEALEVLLPFLQKSRWCAMTKMGESIY